MADIISFVLNRRRVRIANAAAEKSAADTAAPPESPQLPLDGPNK